jgi:hypothetical protein
MTSEWVGLMLLALILTGMLSVLAEILGGQDDVR